MRAALDLECAVKEREVQRGPLTVSVWDVPELQPFIRADATKLKGWIGQSRAIDYCLRHGDRFEHVDVPSGVPRWPQFVAGDLMAPARVALFPKWLADRWSYRIIEFLPKRSRAKWSGEFIVIESEGRIRVAQQFGYFPRDGGDRVLHLQPAWPWNDDTLHGPIRLGEEWDRWARRALLRDVSPIRSGNLVES